MTSKPRIFLSAPHLTGSELGYIETAFDQNWVAPIGPNIDEFEQEFCEVTGLPYAAAISSGTAALHLGLICAGVVPGDQVLCSSFTFVASANPIRYCGATPVFIDSEASSWNMDPDLLEEALASLTAAGQKPKAVVCVDLFGQCADYHRITSICERHRVALVEDAAEALGATYHGKPAGSFGRCAAFSFNGNKIITTSGGGMLCSDDPDLIAHARKLSTQARDKAAHYEHSEQGFNYRMSNVVAGIGRAQVAQLGERVKARREIFKAYRAALADLPGIAFMPEPDGSWSTRWLSCITIDPATAGTDRETVRLALAEENIEARPVWKPMHQQPLFAGCRMFGGAVAEDIFAKGLCLPSSSFLAPSALERVISVVRSCFPA